jgi:hypothetical protein
MPSLGALRKRSRRSRLRQAIARGRGGRNPWDTAVSLGRKKFKKTRLALLVAGKGQY